MGRGRSNHDLYTNDLLNTILFDLILVESLKSRK